MQSVNQLSKLKRQKQQIKLIQMLIRAVTRNVTKCANINCKQSNISVTFGKTVNEPNPHWANSSS